MIRKLRSPAAPTHPASEQLRPGAVPRPRSGDLIRVSEPLLGAMEAEAVASVMESGIVSSASPMVGAFESALARQCETDYAVAVTCGTHALELLLYCFGAGPPDEVIVPATTFISVGAAVAKVGARPVFVDVSREDLNMPVDGVRAAITERTRGVIGVHTYGHPCDMPGLASLCEERDLFLIEDACEAMGADVGGRPVGGLGDAAVHSFYANKMMTTGNGGAITTRHSGLHRLLTELRGYSYAPGRFFWHVHMPFNVRMSGLQAAVGKVQLERLHEIVAGRARVAARYAAGLSGLAHLTLPTPATRGRHVYWMYTVHVNRDAGLSASGLGAWLAEAGIESRGVFSPLHVQPVLQAAASPAQGPFPNAEWAAATGVNLPSGSGLEDSQIDRVIGAVRRYLESA